MAEKKQFGTRLSDHLSDLVTKRADNIQESQGGYIALIVQWWYAQGAPPVNEYEAKFLADKKASSSAKRAS